ncbi:carboxymuconolactone decarboxylase family protein [Jinshanibacter sp. LJY008]|uniref:Carboxymuconolactone decarboxylase family protein n=1 Tax=Limnobaculum eriocheiris TaxID=2897391 RepID=A0A9X1MXT3_9GAMM|nr:carboxymuconolactone decarboxylase family protein [Limnobaculum eriocheiris]MCD1127571.1 carboxymuconolactone decarboxylase family protein [Limnobaculum eriocheiris]
MSQLRLSYPKLSPQAYQGLIACKQALHGSSVGPELIALLDLRISQINGCAFCLKMHTDELRKLNVSNDKIDTLAGWQISSAFSEKEKVALQWAEGLTHISVENSSDELYQRLQQHFTDSEISDLTLAIGLMNAFNRIAISLRQ